jgi:hypothetical protein
MELVMMARPLEQKDCAAAALLLLTQKTRCTTQQVLPVLKPFHIMTFELSSETNISVLKIVFINKCLAVQQNQEQAEHLV